MSHPIFQVDAFTDRAFAGNPAGVCLLDRPGRARWMQAVAAEMNVAETAFLVPRTDGFGLRWFTPAVEVDLCGHATLASAHVLWEEGVLGATEEARFHTRSGLLTARRDGASIAMSFPAEPPSKIAAPKGLARALGAPIRYCGRNRMDVLVELADEAAVRALAPAPGALRGFPMRGVIATARSRSSRADFVSRFFAPAAGVDEDPVTGSAHCALGPYWGSKLGKTRLTGFQASARGGYVRVRLDGSRVVLVGKAVTVLRGTLVV